MRDERLQLGEETVGQRAHGLLAVQARRVGPGEGEAAVLDAADHVQEVGAELPAAAVAARVGQFGGVQPLRSGGRLLAGGRHHVELAVVVEGDLRFGKVPQGVGGGAGRAEVTQGAVAEAPVGDGAELLLDRRHRLLPPSPAGRAGANG